MINYPMMTGIDNILHAVVLEFPQFENNITAMYSENNGFMEICEDYVICQEAIKKLELMNDPKKEKEIIDLKNALTELREELLSQI